MKVRLVVLMFFILAVIPTTIHAQDAAPAQIRLVLLAKENAILQINDENSETVAEITEIEVFSEPFMISPDQYYQVHIQQGNSFTMGSLPDQPQAGHEYLALGIAFLDGFEFELIDLTQLSHDSQMWFEGGQNQISTLAYIPDSPAILLTVSNANGLVFTQILPLEMDTMFPDISRATWAIPPGMYTVEIKSATAPHEPLLSPQSVTLSPDEPLILVVTSTEEDVIAYLISPNTLTLWQ